MYIYHYLRYDGQGEMESFKVDVLNIDNSACNDFLSSETKNRSQINDFCLSIKNAHKLQRRKIKTIWWSIGRADQMEN